MPYDGSPAHRQLLQQALKYLRDNKGITMEAIATSATKLGYPVSRPYVSLILNADFTDLEKKWSYDHVYSVFNCIEKESKFNTDIINASRMNPGMRDDAYYFAAAARYFNFANNMNYAKIANMTGKFAMFRPIWSSDLTGYFIRSIVTISKSGDAFLMEEYQKYKDPKGKNIEEASTGYIFVFGSLLFSMSKEENEMCVRFIAINDFDPPLTAKFASIEIFTGQIKSIAPGNLGPQLQSFICKRIHDNDMVAKVITAGDLDESEKKFFGLVMKQRKEKDLDSDEKRFIALKFREAILNQDRRAVTKLTESYNPHYVHAAFKESAEYPGEVNVFRFAREIAEHGRAPVSDEFKKFLMRTVLGAIALTATVSFVL